MATYVARAGFQGSDYEQLFAFAQRIEDGRDRVDTVCNSVLAMSDWLTWKGEDRDAFFADFLAWLPEIRHAIKVIGDNAHELRQRADAQQQASLA